MTRTRSVAPYLTSTLARRRVVLAVAALALASLTACGGSGATSDAGASTSSGGAAASGTAGSTAPSESSGSSEPAAAAVITIVDFAFATPASIPAGATVTVTNKDSTAHTVTATGKGGFDVTIQGGASETFTAPDAPGSYPFVCTFHGNMSGVLTVT